jgi:fructokinase
MRIGIDLGGTKTEAIALDHNGHELHRRRVPTPQGDYPATIAAIQGLVQTMEELTGQTGTVGIGIPGTIVRSTGLVKNANSTWLNGQPLERDLSFALEREVRCARAYDLVFGVILGTGCGGGIAIGHRVHAGRNGLGGEWGHLPLPWPSPAELPGPPCYCGKSGCIETWISGTGFERDFLTVTGQHLRGHQIVTAANAGDPAAAAAIDRLLDRIARSLTILIDILDPDAIVLGGGLSNLDRLYDGSLSARLSAYTFGGAVDTPILRNLHGDSSGVRGAAWLWPL